eukprot:TRINITY_DN2515_c0_g2_i4.p1 TRINITY_DN2515_c0_g2~~TRINITY_DN2515_c0_g2_i4.p1  ORF type:complete len:312 (+),score=95.12 TRINITY_DN2515_c0_g2_i4:72-1007(+)
MIRRPPRSTQGVSSAASDVYKRQENIQKSSDGKEDIIFSPATKGYIEEAERSGNLEIRQKFVESKFARKQAEQDRLLLMNRIALLKIEEQKAVKKIESMKKKAKEITEIRMRNAKIAMQKEEWRKKKMENEEKQAAENRALREGLKNGIATKQMQTLDEKKNLSHLIKSESDHAKLLISSSLSEEHEKKCQIKQAIKDQEIALTEMKKREQEEKKAKAISIVEEKISQEKEEKLRIDADISKLKQEEDELIQRLQRSELAQQAAAKSLEKEFESSPTTKATKSPLSKSGCCLLYTSPSPRDLSTSRMPSSA